MNNIPDRIDIEKSNRKLYDDIEIFKNKNRKEQFLLAMSVGFKNKVKHPIKSRDGFFLIKDMKPEDEALIKAVAIKDEGSVEVLSSLDKVFNIVEEYANAGIKVLYDMVTSTQYGSFMEILDKELFDIYNEIKNQIS